MTLRRRRASTATSSAGASETGRSWTFRLGSEAPNPGPGGHIREGDTNSVVLYVQVQELRATLERAAQIGGQVTADPFDLPDGRTVAFITDPERNALGLVQA